MNEKHTLHIPSVSWAKLYLSRLQEAKFYGKLIIELRDGEIVLLRKEETIKPPSID